MLSRLPSDVSRQGTTGPPTGTGARAYVDPRLALDAGHILIRAARRPFALNVQDARKERQVEKTKVEFVELPPQGLSVEALASMLAVSSAEVIKELFMKGIMVTVNQV